MTALYVLEENFTEEPVQFVGVYVLKWGTTTQPTVGFRDINDEELERLISHAREHPDKPARDVMVDALMEE